MAVVNFKPEHQSHLIKNSQERLKTLFTKIFRVSNTLV